MRYGPDGAAPAVCASVPSTEAMKARNALATSSCSVVAGDVGAGRHPQRHPVGLGVSPGWAKKPMFWAASGSRAAISDMANVSIGYWAISPSIEHLQGVLVGRRAVVLVPPVALVGLLQALEAAQRRRRVGVVGLVGRVLLGEVGRLLGDVVVVGEDEQLRRPRRAERGADRGDPRLLQRVVVGGELLPRRRHGQAVLLEDVRSVEDAAAETGTERHAEDAVALAHRRDERVDDVVEHRVTGEVDDRLRRVERLQQRARVVEEHVGHLVRRQAGLDDVVAVGAAGRSSMSNETFGCSSENAEVSPSVSSTVVSVLSISNDSVTSSPPANSAARRCHRPARSCPSTRRSAIAIAIDAATPTPLMNAKALSPLLIAHSPFSLRPRCPKV